MSGRQRWGYVIPEHCAVQIIAEKVGKSLLWELLSLLLAWAVLEGAPCLLLDAVGDFRPSLHDCSCHGLSSVSPPNSTGVIHVLLGGFIRSSCQEMWVSAEAAPGILTLPRRMCASCASAGDLVLKL